MEEIKDFFIDNEATKIYNRFYLDIGNYYELVLQSKTITIVDIETDQEITILNPTLDRVKALIYGLTGKNLD